MRPSLNDRISLYGSIWLQSRYAFSPQDTEFSFPSSSSRRGYNDFPGCGIGGNGGSANSLGGGGGGNMCNLPPMTSNNSLNNLCGLSLGSGGSDDHMLNDQRPSNTNLIVNYLPQDMTDRELYALFRAIGPINTCRIMRDYKVRLERLSLSLRSFNNLFYSLLDWLQFWIRFRGLHIRNGLAACDQSPQRHHSA